MHGHSQHDLGQVWEVNLGALMPFITVIQQILFLSKRLYKSVPLWCTWGVTRKYPLPSLDSNRLRATVSSLPRGKLPQVTIPSSPDYANDARHETSHADTTAYEPQNEPGTACRDAYSALLRNRLCAPLFLAGVFDSEELHMLNRGHRNGLSSCRLGCHLGSRFGCTLG